MRRLLGHTARIALGLIFGYAALLKAADISAFAAQIADYGLTPASWGAPLARFFVAVEFGLTAALLANFKPRWTAAATGLLLVVFMGAIALAWSRGYTGSCGCFGSHGPVRGPKGALIEDSVFLVLAAVAFWGLAQVSGNRLWQRGLATVGVVLGLLLPSVAPALPVDGWVTAARRGGQFDHVVVEGFDGDIHSGRHLVALLDPAGEASIAAIEALNALDTHGDVPPVVGVVQGTSDDVATLIFEHDAAFELGYAPRQALKRFYRRLPVFLELADGTITGTWFDRPPPAGAW